MLNVFPLLAGVCVCVGVGVAGTGRGTAFRNDYLVSDRADEYDPEDFPNLSTNGDEEIRTRPPLDPKGSWLEFVRHSDRINNRKMSKNKRKKKRKTLVRKTSQGSLLRSSEPKAQHGPIGPPGPPGPQGPAGPPGAVITKEEMLAEFRTMVKEAAEKRAEELLTERCEACSSLLNGSYVLPPEVDEVLLVPRVTVAFHMRLRSNIIVARRTFMELKNFHQPFGGGAFHRGDVFNARDGRFVAPRDGVYHFAANLHIQIKKKGRGSKRLRKRDNIKVQVCIDSLCQKNTSLEYVTGLETNSKLFTTSVSGLLELKAGQYASVYMDNSSGIVVRIQNGSDFTGILFGV
ncbi:adipolin-like isoform X1 [Haliotis cracherodii]|uniref:adipolin-like isoform X1 n=1 Tax=Haliotis rufescens TaxID=6454 RepID=UPI001EAF9987|nr:adipolin-like isoform X1 [Haliotis rufescens]